MGIEAVGDRKPFNLLKSVRRVVDSLRRKPIVEAQSKEVRGLLSQLQGSKFLPTTIDG